MKLVADEASLWAKFQKNVLGTVFPHFCPGLLLRAKFQVYRIKRRLRSM